MSERTSCSCRHKLWSCSWEAFFTSNPNFVWMSLWGQYQWIPWSGLTCQVHQTKTTTSSLRLLILFPGWHVDAVCKKCTSSDILPPLDWHQGAGTSPWVFPSFAAGAWVSSWGRNFTFQLMHLSCVVVCGVFTYISVSTQKEAFWLVLVLMPSSNQPLLQSVDRHTSRLQ